MKRIEREKGGDTEVEIKGVGRAIPQTDYVSLKFQIASMTN